MVPPSKPSKQRKVLAPSLGLGGVALAGGVGAYKYRKFLKAEHPVFLGMQALDNVSGNVYKVFSQDQVRRVPGEIVHAAFSSALGIPKTLGTSRFSRKGQNFVLEVLSQELDEAGRKAPIVLAGTLSKPREALLSSMHSLLNSSGRHVLPQDLAQAEALFTKYVRNKPLFWKLLRV